MTKILNPIFEDSKEKLFESTKHRFFSIISPIQRVNNKKESDFVAYLINPLLDVFILGPVFTLDAWIHLLNALASFAKASYLWSINQNQNASLIDEKAKKELEDGVYYLLHSLSMIIAETLNGIFSCLALLTRPVASIAQVCFGEENNYESANNVILV